MKRKGFTLVELLAVIVIMTIIALIVVPSILGVIDKAEKGALKSSAYGLIEAATLYYAQNGVVETERFELSEDNKLSYKGSVENGTLLINSKGKIMVCINDGDNAAYKNYSDTSVVVVSGKTCNVNTSETQVLLDGENTIDEYTNQELTELVDTLQNKISTLETEIGTLKENKTETSATAALEEAVNTKADLTALTSLSNQHTTDINRIDNKIATINISLNSKNNFQGNSDNSLILNDSYLVVANQSNNAYRPIHTSDILINGQDSIVKPKSISVTISEDDGYISSQALGGIVRNRRLDVNGVIFLGKEIPTGSIINLGRIITEQLPINTVYFSFQVPNGLSYLGKISTEGIVTIYNYSGSTIIANTQIYPVGLSWYF